MMIPYPQISPEIIRIGPFAIRWYGVMYIVGYMVGTRIAKDRVRHGLVPFDEHAVDALVGYLFVGMLAGARLFYVLVYDRPQYAAHPLDVFAIWHGGLSFHGALIGMATAAAIFAYRNAVPFWTVADTIAFAGAPGLFFGRLGNFINGALWGRPTHVAWAMIFPADPLGLPRHPSQIYEALGEGLLLFCVLWVMQRRTVRGGWYQPGQLTAAFLIGYGVLRFLIEFTRQPDAQLGFVAGPLSMGQLLCMVMIAAGLVLGRRMARSSVAVAPAGS